MNSETFLSTWKVFTNNGVPVGEFRVHISEYEDEISQQLVQKTFELWCTNAGLDVELHNYSVK